MGGDKDIDHANAMAEEWSAEDNREYCYFLDNRYADKPKESEVNDR